MQKEKIRNSILGILAFVLLFYEIIVLKGENYYLVSMAVLLIALFGFFAHFEKERPGYAAYDDCVALRACDCRKNCFFLSAADKTNCGCRNFGGCEFWR